MAAKKAKKSMAKKNVREGVKVTATELRRLALLRRAYDEGQRAMRRQMHEWLGIVLFADDWGATDVLDVTKTYPLRDPPAWMQVPKRGRAKRSR
jgi:hypothetical protein